jgi:hypothetical protein
MLLNYRVEVNLINKKLALELDFNKILDFTLFTFILSNLIRAHSY